jgi:hypothetical protein
MLLWIVLLLFLFVILSPPTGFQRTLALRYEREVHPYSGLDPDEWQKFKENVRAFEQEEDPAVAARQLYAAMENIRNLGLGIQRPDDIETRDTLDGIAGRLALDGEYMLYTQAKKQGLYFFPRYLNNTDYESPDDFKRGGVVGDPGVHFPDPKSHGQ